MIKVLVILGVISLIGVSAGLVTTQAADPTRPDCPGTIECPLTGEVICADRCPAQKPPCCR